MNTSHQLNQALKPRSIALIGASDRPNSRGAVLWRNLVNGGFQGSLYPINPKYQFLGEIPCYQSIKEIADPIDLVILATPAKAAEKLLSEIAQIYQPQTISSTELTEDGFLVYGANGIIGKYKDYNHETEQICITCRGNTCGMVNYTKPMSWITGNAMVINTDKYQDKVCKRYLYHYLSAYNFNSIISGSGQPQIVRTPLEKLKITFTWKKTNKTVDLFTFLI